MYNIVEDIVEAPPTTVWFDQETFDTLIDLNRIDYNDVVGIDAVRLIKLQCNWGSFNHYKIDVCGTLFLIFSIHVIVSLSKCLLYIGFILGLIWKINHTLWKLRDFLFSFFRLEAASRLKNWVYTAR